LKGNSQRHFNGSQRSLKRYSKSQRILIILYDKLYFAESCLSVLGVLARIIRVLTEMPTSQRSYEVNPVEFCTFYNSTTCKGRSLNQSSIDHLHKQTLFLRILEPAKVHSQTNLASTYINKLTSLLHFSIC